jgi:glutaminyl-peptide cyclotransferase
LLIDFDYPHWHKISDTLDKCSPKSLNAVFSVLVGVLAEW